VGLLAEVDAAWVAVVGPESLVYPLVHVPVARRREDLQNIKICKISPIGTAWTHGAFCSSLGGVYSCNVHFADIQDNNCKFEF